MPRARPSLHNLLASLLFIPGCMVEVPELAERPPDASGADAAGGDVSGDGADVLPDVTEEQDAGLEQDVVDALGCEAGQKPCGQACVDDDDPAFGCTDPGCVPCVNEHGGVTCSAGACAITSCDPGWEDCNGDAVDGCEAEPMRDASNCGWCGYDCRGASCKDGRCDAIPVAMGLSKAWSVVVDDSDAYVTVAAGTENLYRVDKAGGVPVSLVPGEAGAEGQVLLDGDYVYWANSEAGLVRRLHKTSGGSPEVVGESLSPRFIAMDGTHIYWTDYGADSGNGFVWRAPKAPSGSTPYEIANSLQRPAGLKLIDDKIFVGTRDTGALYRLPKAGGTAEVLHAGDTDSTLQGWNVAYDGSYVYWFSAPDLLRLPVSGTGAETSIGNQNSSGRDIVFADGMLFWCSSFGSEWRLWAAEVASPDSARILLDGYQCHGLTVDDSFVYVTVWQAQAGPAAGLMRIARPPSLP